jgi:phage terminase small subunit
MKTRKKPKTKAAPAAGSSKLANKRRQREETFAREYVIDLNGSRAAIAAGYSEKGADVRAVELLGNSRVKALIASLTKDRFGKLDISAERILQELARLAFIDPANLFDEAGSLKSIHRMDEDSRRAIAALDHEKLFEHFGKGQAKHVGAMVKVKLADKTRALQLLGQYRKLFTEKVEFDAAANFTEALARILARKRGRPTGSH